MILQIYLFDMILWKDIPEYNGYYQASNTGLIKRLDSIIGHNKGGNRKWKGRLMKARDRKGYLSVNLSINGKTKQVPVHRLVASAFLINEVSKPCINHKNGNPKDNSVENLEWCTWSENTKHAFDTGLLKMPKGEQHYSTKFSESDICKIRELYKIGNNQLSIAAMYGVDQSTISLIVNNKNWKHL